MKFTLSERWDFGFEIFIAPVETILFSEEIVLVTVATAPVKLFATALQSVVVPTKHVGRTTANVGR